MERIKYSLNGVYSVNFVCVALGENDIFIPLLDSEEMYDDEPSLTNLNEFILSQKGKRIVCESTKGRNIIIRISEAWCLIRDHLDFPNDFKRAILNDLLECVDYYFGVGVVVAEGKSKANVRNVSLIIKE